MMSVKFSVKPAGSEFPMLQKGPIDLFDAFILVGDLLSAFKRGIPATVEAYDTANMRVAIRSDYLLTMSTLDDLSELAASRTGSYLYTFEMDEMPGYAERLFAVIEAHFRAYPALQSEILRGYCQGSPVPRF